jgi:undecaprenyl-diphosphatase
MTYGEALFIGLSQAAAILPGLSRSCCTITSALYLRFTPRDAATFSFLMAIPVIGGACVLELAEIVQSGHFAMPTDQLIAGVAVSFVTGLASLWVLVRWLERGRFADFAWWCIPLGIAVLIWQAMQRS